MKFALLPLLATTLPLLLVQHVTPANAAALCIPGIYCPQEPSPVPTPQCTCSEGPGPSGTAQHASTSTSSTHVPKLSSSTAPKPTTTWTPPTGTVILKPSTTWTPKTSTVVPKPSTTWTQSTSTTVSKHSTTWTLSVTTVIPKPSTTWSPPSISKLTTSIVGEPPCTTESVILSVKPTSSKFSATIQSHSASISSSPAHSSPVGGGSATTTTVTVTDAPQPTGWSCSTGPVQCCNSIQSSDSKDASTILGLLGIVLQGSNVPVGLNCVPISAVGAGSAGNCNAQTVCCQNNNFNGLINIGCSPINIAL